MLGADRLDLGIAQVDAAEGRVGLVEDLVALTEGNGGVVVVADAHRALVH